jgi:hypothetical protein
VALPLLRDERPELNLRELRRIIAERAGLEPDSTAEMGAEPGFDLLPAEPPRGAIGFGVHGERSAGSADRPVRPVRPVDRSA